MAVKRLLYLLNQYSSVPPVGRIFGGVSWWRSFWLY